VSDVCRSPAQTYLCQLPKREITKHRTSQKQRFERMTRFIERRLRPHYLYQQVDVLDTTRKW
jgi:hypothetical protein